MTAYILNLVVMLLLVAGLAVGSLWLWRRVQPGVAVGGRRERLVRVVDAVPLGATGRLAVVEFEGRRILLSVARGRVDKLAEVSAEGEFIDDGGAIAAPYPPARS